MMMIFQCCFSQRNMNFKMIITALLVFCFCLGSHECRTTAKTTRASVKQTVQNVEGNVIDCVDIHNQPSLTHPLLKNHKIQLKPSAFPQINNQEQNSVGTNASSSEEAGFENAMCPDGTVPIYRTTKEEQILAKNISKLLFQSTAGHSHNSLPGLNSHEVLIKVKKTTKIPGFVGVAGSSSIFNLNLKPYQISTSNIWVQGGPPDTINYLMAGTIVSPTLNGDSRPRLFVYWTADNNKKTGCFNFLCKGFIQISPKVVPKSPVEPVSTIAGKIYDCKYNIYQDPITGNWIFVATEQNIMVGYWPKELFTTLAHGADEVAWGGISIGNDGISPAMGSGRYPDGFFDTAAYFRNLQYIVPGLKQVSPQNSDTNVQEVVLDTSGCFKLLNDKLTPIPFWGYRFTFGGPGGGAKCTQ